MDEQNLKAPTDNHTQEPVQQKPDVPIAPPKEQPLKSNDQQTDKDKEKNAEGS